MRRLKGWGLKRGCVLPQLGGLGACPRKKNNFVRKKYAILSNFWYFFPIFQQKVGDYPPSPESVGPIPLFPLLRRLCGIAAAVLGCDVTAQLKSPGGKMLPTDVVRPRSACCRIVRIPLDSDTICIALMGSIKVIESGTIR